MLKAFNCHYYDLHNVIALLHLGLTLGPVGVESISILVDDGFTGRGYNRMTPPSLCYVDPGRKRL